MEIKREPNKKDKKDFFVYDAKDLKDEKDIEDNPVPSFAHPTHNPFVNFSRIFFMRDLRQTFWETYQPGSVIGRNIFTPECKAEFKKKMLKSPAVLEAIAHESQKTNFREALQRAEKIANNMIGEHKEPIARTMAYIVQKVLHQLYSAIHVVQSDRDMLQKYAIRAQEKGISLVFLPTHKLLGLLWFHENISLPFVAAGDNLNMPLVGTLLQKSGAFFIERPFPEDKIYKALFSEFVTEILRNGYNLEFFLEGGRSRTGKLLMPKMGMLRVMINSYLETNKDCYLVPVSISYEKVIETETYIQELLGKTKQPESLQEVIRAVDLLRFDFGQIDIRIGEPVSLHKMVSEKKSKRTLNVHSPLPQEQDAARRQLTNVIAYSVMYSINMICTITPSALVVTILLTQSGRGIGKRELVQKVNWLRKLILDRGGHISSFAGGNAEYMVDKVTFLLRNLITRDTKLLETVYKPNKRFELSYYRNTAMHLFVPESTVACAVYAYVKGLGPTVDSKRGVLKSVLYNDTRYLSRMMKWEFIYKPAQGFDKNFEETFEQMRKRGLLEWNQKDDLVYIPPGGEATNQFFCFLLWPFIDAYWMVCCSLWALFPNYLAEEKTYLTKVTKFGETLYYQGELSFFESVSTDMTKMALQRCLEEQIIERKQINDRGIYVLKLKDEYQRNDKLLEDIVEKIGKYRRQGKYNQDGNFTQKIKDLARLITPKAKH